MQRLEEYLKIHLRTGTSYTTVGGDTPCGLTLVIVQINTKSLFKSTLNMSKKVSQISNNHTLLTPAMVSITKPSMLISLQTITVQRNFTPITRHQDVDPGLVDLSNRHCQEHLVEH